MPQEESVTEVINDPTHFTKAVTLLSEKSPVITTEAIFNDRGIKILEKGVQVDSSLYDRLMGHALTAPLENALACSASISGKVLCEHAEQAMLEVPFFERICTDTKVRSLLLGTLAKVPLPTPMAFQLSMARGLYPVLFTHLVHSALFAGWLTQDRGVPLFDVGLATTAGLLHDIGMLHLDPALLTRQVSIGSDQRRQLYSHPLVARALIERHHEYPRELLRGIAEHHEFLDGSGYPRHLVGSAISPLGRVLSLSELVSTLLVPGRKVPEMRLGVQLRMNRHRYDPVMVKRVQQFLKPQSQLSAEDFTVLPDPIGQLLEIETLVSSWPAEWAMSETLSPSQREGMLAVTSQARQLHRNQAAGGVSHQQLEQLGTDGLDDVLRLELSLIAQESAWQVRTLARAARRRWLQDSDGQYPEILQSWLDRAEQISDTVYNASLWDC